MHSQKHTVYPMRLIFVGKKKNAGANRGVCRTDVMLLSDIEDDDVIAIVLSGRHKFCYDLDALAKWFIQDPINHDTLPTLPETRTPVPALVYKRIVREAHMRVPGFREYFHSKTMGVPSDRRAFVLTGTRSRRTTTSSSHPEDMFSVAELQMLIDGMSDDEFDDGSSRGRRQSRSPRRSPSRSRDAADLAAMLPDAAEIERMMGDISDSDLLDLFPLRGAQGRRSPARRRRRSRGR